MRRWLGSGLAALLLLVVAVTPIFAADPTPAPAGVRETLTGTLAVVLLNFSNDSSQPYTPATAAGVVFSSAGSVANFFEEESRGAVQVTGDVYGWYTIASTNANCAWGTWQSDAVAAAQAAGVSFSTYTNIVFACPHTSSCGWAGLGYMPGN